MIGRLVDPIVDIWRVEFGRRAAVRRIGPLVAASASRLHGIEVAVWRHPYFIGLIGMAITIVALSASRGRLRGEHLGAVQLAAWKRITGYCDTDIGEDMLILSTMRDPEFEAGCRWALLLLSGPQQVAVETPHEIAGDANRPLAGHAASLDAHWQDQWRQAFDERVIDLRTRSR